MASLAEFERIDVGCGDETLEGATDVSEKDCIFVRISDALKRGNDKDGFYHAGGRP